MVDVSHPKDLGQQITRSFKVPFQYGLLCRLLNELELSRESHGDAGRGMACTGIQQDL